MYGTIYFLLIIFVIGVLKTNEVTDAPFIDRFVSCITGPNFKFECPKINKIDLVILIESTDTNLTASNFSVFLRSLVSRTNFLYGPENVRRAILITDEFKTFYVRQNFNHSQFVSEPEDYLLKPPYNESGESNFVEVTESWKIHLRPDTEKIVLYLTWTSTDFKLESLKKLTDQQFTVYLVVFTQVIGNMFDFWEFFVADVLPIFPQKNLLPYLVLTNNDVQQRAYKFSECMCNLVEHCQYVKDNGTCHYRRFETSEKCERNESVTILRQSTSKNLSCSEPYETAESCDKFECDADCDLKGWGLWSECWENGTKTRKRINASTSLSEYTQSCHEIEMMNCNTTVIPIKVSLGVSPLPGIDNRITQSNNTTTYAIIGVCIGIALIALFMLIIVILVVKRRKAKKSNVDKKLGTSGKEGKQSKGTTWSPSPDYEMLNVKEKSCASTTTTLKTTRSKFSQMSKSAKTGYLISGQKDSSVSKKQDGSKAPKTRNTQYMIV